MDTKMAGEPPTGAMRAEDITIAWLGTVLKKGGYDTKPSDSNPEVLQARYDGGRPNLTVRVRAGDRIISFTHFWKMKKPGWGQEGNLLGALNKANSQSWYDTFARDSDGDLMVSSYLFMAEGVSEGDVLAFVEKEAAHFLQVVNVAGLMQWLQ